MSNSARWILLGPFALALCACSSGPLEREEARALAGQERVHRAVHIDVECPGGDLFGTEEEWEADLLQAFRDLDVCEVAWTSKERAAAEADLSVKVSIVEGGAIRDPEIDGRGALLCGIAWSTVPLLPWWIGDVDVNPGVSATVMISSLPAPPGRERPSGGEIVECPPIHSCLLDRQPALSWPTLGAILLPPFVFTSVNRAHFRSRAAHEVRQEVALQVARIVKERPEDHPEAHPEVQKPLLSRMSLEISGDRWILAYAPSADLKKISLWAEPRQDRKVFEHVITIQKRKTEISKLSLRNILPASEGAGRLLRMESLDRLGRRERFSLRFPGKESGGAPEER